jgi:hypothetical protein
MPAKCLLDYGSTKMQISREGSIERAHMKILLLFSLLFTQLVMAVDAFNRDNAYITIPSAQTTINPTTTKPYRITPDTLFRTTEPGPAQMRTSQAWSIANEFVFRTSLRNKFVLPASSAGAEGKGGGLYVVAFERKGGGKRLKVQVDIENRTVRIIEGYSPLE